MKNLNNKIVFADLTEAMTAFQRKEDECAAIVQQIVILIPRLPCFVKAYWEMASSPTPTLTIKTENSDVVNYPDHKGSRLGIPILRTL